MTCCDETSFESGNRALSPAQAATVSLIAYAQLPPSSAYGLQINKVFQQFVKRVQQDVWERDFA